MEQEELSVPTVAAVAAKAPKRSAAKQPGKAKEPKPVVEEQQPAVVEEKKPVAINNKPAVPELQEEGDEEEATPAAPPAKLFVVEEHHDTNEVIERLLDVKGMTESVSGLWGWMQGSAAKVAEAASEAKIRANEVKEQTVLKASQLKEQATSAATQLQRGLEEATSTAPPPPVVATTVAPLPWDALPLERRNEAKERILKLSMDDLTFTVPPPSAFQYDPAAREAVAHRMLDTDALLSAKRFKLVPKSVSEVDFWRNYFYRVELVLAGLGSQVVAAAAVEQAPATPPAPTQADRDFDEEMRKDLAEADSSENFDMLDDDDLEFDDEDEADLAKELQ